jgi:hypothetical protein
MQGSVDLASVSQTTATIPFPGARRAGGDSVVGWVIPGTLLISASVFFLCFLISGTPANLQCAVALAITAAPFLIAAAEAPGRLLHPLSIFGFTMLLGVAGQTIYLTHGNPAALPDLLSGLSPDTLSRGLLVVSVGVIALGVGYLASSPARGKLEPGRLLKRGMALGLSRPSPQRTFWAVSALCALSAGAFAVYAPKVGIHTPADLLSSRKRFVGVGSQQTVYGYYRFVIGLSGVGFILAVYTIAQNRLVWRSRLGGIALVSILLTAGFAIVTSSRTEFFAVVAAAALVIIALRQREPNPLLVGTAVVLALAGLGLLLGLRQADQAASSRPTSATNAASPGAILDEATGSREWMAVGPISVVVARVPHAYPYQYGKTLISILWAPIPRTLWAGKPPVSLGPAISPAVFGFDLQRRTGDPPGIIGELWINGALLAVVLGMTALGIGIRRAERWYQLASATDGLAALPYGVLVVALCLLIPGNDVTLALARVLEELTALGLFLWIVRDRPEPGRPATATSSDRFLNENHMI